MAIVAAGTVSYNNVTFTSLFHTNVSAKDVYDHADRMVKYIEYTITVSGYVVAADGATSTTDPSLDTLRVNLSTPGKPLRYSDKGFGTFSINTSATSQWDVKWGPKPQILEFVPVGSSQSAMVTWKVIVCIPECPNSKYRYKLSELCYSTSWDIDEQGLTTISHTGDFEIPLTFWNAYRLGDSADRYWNSVCPATPIGFQRVRNNRTLSEDRRTINFSITDKQLPVALPNDCTMTDIRHRLRSDPQGNGQGNAFVNWMATISGTVRTRPGVPKSLALSRFMQVVASRINQVRASQVPGRAPAVGPARPARNSGLIIRSFEMEEDVFTFESRFSITYRLVGTSLASIVEVSGLWMPINDFSHPAWNNSVNGRFGPHDSRGWAGMYYDIRQDAIIDLCTEGGSSGSAPPRVVAPPQGNPPGRKVITPPPDATGPNPPTLDTIDLTIPPPPPPSTWLRYETRIEEKKDYNIVEHVPLDAMVSMSRPRINAFSDVDAVRGDTSQQKPPVSSNTDSIIQRLAKPTVRISLIGYGERIGYDVPIPRLLTYAGQEVELVREMTNSGFSGSVNGIPVVLRVWNCEYVIARPPQASPLPTNPVTLAAGLVSQQ